MQCANLLLHNGMSRRMRRITHRTAKRGLNTEYDLSPTGAWKISKSKVRPEKKFARPCRVHHLELQQQ